MSFRLAVVVLTCFAMGGLHDAAQSGRGGQAPRPGAAQQARAAAQPQKPAGIFPLAVAWTAALGTAPSAPPAFDDSRAFVALRAVGERPGQLVAVSLADGSKRWSRNIGEVLSLAAGDDLVLAGVGVGPGLKAGTYETIEALGAEDGEPTWQHQLGAAASVPIYRVSGWVLAAPGGSQLVALRARDGSKVWQVALPGPLVAAPAVSGDALYVPIAGNRVLRLKLEDGATTWQATLKAEPSTILALEDSVFVGTRNRSFYSLDPRNGHTRWRVRAGSEVVPVPVAGDSEVYVVTLANMIRAFDRRGGSLRAQHVLTRRAYFGPFDAGSVMLVSGRSMLIEGYTTRRLDPAGAFEAPPELAGRIVVGPIHVVRGMVEKDVLIVTTTGEGEVVALRPSEMTPR